MMMRKKKGSLFVDVLMGMLILLLGIMPLVASMGFAYSATTSSVDKTRRLNELYGTTDEAILGHSINNTEGAFLAGFNNPSTAVLVGGNPTTPPTALYYREIALEHVDGREGGTVRLYVIKQP